MQRTILIADIGGTNSRFQIWQGDRSLLGQADSQAWLCVSDQRYASQSFVTFDALLDQVIASANEVSFQAVVIGAAGPVQAAQVQFTNLNWLISEANLQKRFPQAQVALLNDFTVAAYALDSLTSDDRQIIYSPSSQQTNDLRLLVGAGTGLGVALLRGYGAGLSVVATEAGHVDFAPITQQDAQLQAWLMQSWTHVSFERLVSGDGLVAIYQFLTQHSTFLPANGPSAADIASLANRGDKEAIAAIRLFWGYYGQFIGNMVLCWPAFGGIYIAGGMAPKLVRWIKESEFLTRLQHKGRMQPIVENCALHLVKPVELGLLGARNYASHQRHA
jgi:glucokinase